MRDKHKEREREGERGRERERERERERGRERERIHVKNLIRRELGLDLLHVVGADLEGACEDVIRHGRSGAKERRREDLCPGKLTIESDDNGGRNFGVVLLEVNELMD